MAERITSKDLEAMALQINKLTGSPMEYRIEGKAATGHFLIDAAYGGYSLSRVTKGGGETDIFNRGHIPAKELYWLCRAFMQGIEFAQVK